MSATSAPRLPRGSGRGHRARPARPLPWGALGVVTALLAWEILALVVHNAKGIPRLAGPASVVARLISYATGGLVTDVLSSLEVFAGGWIAGGLAGVLIGVALGRVRLLGELFLPVVEAMRPVSSIAWVPLSIVWFGLGYASKAFVVGLAVFLVVIVYAVDSATRIHKDVERAADMLGMRGIDRLRFVVLPGIISEVLVGLRVALMAGWGTVIIAELTAADTGLGEHLVSAQQSYDIPEVMATMVCFAVVGFALNALFSGLQNLLVPWQRGGRSE